MTNAEVIEALQNCANVNYEYRADDASCSKCPYNKISYCKRTMMRAAADAIKTLCDELATYHAKSVTDEQRIADQQKQITKLDILLDNKIEELEAQFLKEGEWKWNSLLNEYEWVDKTFYCPNCGVRMRKGEQEKTK